VNVLGKREMQIKGRKDGNKRFVRKNEGLIKYFEFLIDHGILQQVSTGKSQNINQCNY